MITHCPSCHTHFRVHAEQLAARAGQVRCGKCSRVFNALEHLIEEIAPLRPSPPAPVVDAAYAENHRVDQGPEPELAPAADPGAEIMEPVAEKPIDGATESMHAGTATAQTAMPEPAIPEYSIPEPKKIGAEAISGTNSFSFGPPGAAEPARTGRRWLWLSGTFLLVLLLLAQAAYQYRGTVVLLLPEVKPYAAALCANLGCDLPLPRRIDLLSIEASDLQADTTNPNVMVLSATLKNRAIFSQQHPLLELTLTDAQDQPVVRRVLAPADYLGKNVGTQAGFAANTEIAVKVFIEGSQVKATGYRLYLFYP